MALKSALFHGDSQLEAAAVSDAAHITQGARGEHVRKIQLALIQLDGAKITADGSYGPATAAAVLAYKRKRKIINPAYQQQADDIVGRMTIDRLDTEMLAAEQINSDRTIRCIFKPDIRQSPQRSFAVGDSPTGLTGFQLLGEARASLPLAQSWVTATLAKISLVESRLGRAFTSADIAFFSSIETHFKVNIPTVTEAVAKDRLLKVRRMYEKIQNVLTIIATDRLVGNPGVLDKALAGLGGINFPREVITIGSDFHSSNANMRAAVLIHEGAHFADANCSHAASEQPSPNGEAIDDRFGAAVNPRQLSYAQLDFNLHMQNAYSFAQCAMHNGLGFDKRPP